MSRSDRWGFIPIPAAASAAVGANNLRRKLREGACGGRGRCWFDAGCLHRLVPVLLAQQLEENVVPPSVRGAGGGLAFLSQAAEPVLPSGRDKALGSVG